VPQAKVFYRMPDATGLSAIGLSSTKMASLFRSTRLHIADLRSFEDSETVRHACLLHLQRRVALVSPDRTDIFEQARQLALELGGHLQVPRAPGKYLVVEALLGRRATHRIRIVLPQVRWSLARLSARTVSHLTQWIRRPRG